MNKKRLLLIVASNTFAAEVTKEAWIDGMATGLPAYQCQAEKYFRQCFKVDATKCEEVMTSTTRLCLDKERGKIPDLLNKPQDGSKWGRVVGMCAGQSYELALIKSRINNAKCNSIENWK